MGWTLKDELIGRTSDTPQQVRNKKSKGACITMGGGALD